MGPADIRLAEDLAAGCERSLGGAGSLLEALGTRERAPVQAIGALYRL